jgi:DnaJ-domain-containing protein 1
MHPNWRDDPAAGAANGQAASGGESALNEALALEILGLQPGASADEITLAHRRLMQKLHPDRGGSDYLAQRINAARDYLLG